MTFWMKCHIRWLSSGSALLTKTKLIFINHNGNYKSWPLYSCMEKISGLKRVKFFINNIYCEGLNDKMESLRLFYYFSKPSASERFLSSVETSGN